MKAREKLQEAMERLLSGGIEGRHNGALNMVNLAKEAGVGRATLYRHPDIVEEFESRVAKEMEDGERSENAIIKIKSLEDKLVILAKEKAKSERELLGTISSLSQKVQVLTIKLANMEEIHGQSKGIIPICR